MLFQEVKVEGRFFFSPGKTYFTAEEAADYLGMSLAEFQLSGLKSVLKDQRLWIIFDLMSHKKQRREENDAC